MYFASRTQAGRQLAAKIWPKYHQENCVVMALSDGGALVGAQIAAKLLSPMTMLLNAEIKLPQEPQAIAGITEGGTFAYNHEYSQGELEELQSEYYGYIESEKLTQLHKLNQLVGPAGITSKDLLRGRNVIIVADGLKSGFELDIAAEFLKPIAIKKMIVAVPFASLPAVDRMHVLADDLFCLSVIADYFDTNHYYDDNHIPEHQTVLTTIEHLVSNWR